jgi:hypothetical protein
MTEPRTPTGKRLLASAGYRNLDDAIPTIEAEAAAMERAMLDGRVVKMLHLARRALAGYRIDHRSHSQFVSEDVFPAIDSLLADLEGRPHD